MENPISNRPRTINAEPILFLYSVGIGLYVSVYQAFISFKFCLIEAKDSSVIPPEESVHDFCMELIGSAKDTHSNLTNDLRDTIEEKASTFMIYYSLANNMPAILMAFLVGAWSDAFGRKPPVIVALGGSTVGAFIVLAAAVWDEAPLYLVIISTLVNGCTGQVLVIYSGAFAMISDSIRDPVQLTIRIGVASGILALGFFVAGLISGAVLSKWDDYVIICTGSIIFIAVSFLYTVFVAQETLHLVKPAPNEGPTEVGATIQSEGSQILDDASELDTVIPETKRHCCRTLFNFDIARESFNTLVRARPERHRLYLLLSLLGFFIVFSCDLGMPGIANLYLKLPPISVTDSQFSYLTALGTGASATGMVVLPWLAKRVLHVRDTFLVVFGLTLTVGKMFIVAFATNVWMIIVATIIGGISTVYFTGWRAFMSKLVGRDESGRLFAVVTTSEHIGPLISALVFNNIFAATLHWFAGCVFVVTAICCAFILVLMSWIHFDSGRRHDDVDDVNQPEIQEADREPLVE